MENSEKRAREGEVLFGDLFRPLIVYARLIWQVSLVVTVVTALLGALYLTVQPTAWSATIGFRPVFDGADIGKYPNGLPFAASDITQASVIGEVFAKNDLKAHCSLDAFRNGLVVDESSPALQFLTVDYQARLSDPRLTVLDRQRLQDEYTARRQGLAREYRLVFVRPAACRTLPEDLSLKAMAEVLETWANESQERRGVLRMTAVLSPTLFDLHESDGDSLLVRSDLVRAAIVRVIANIVEVEKMPGAEFVRFGPSRVTLAEVRLRLEDLVQARLDPLIRMAGRGLGRDSLQWVTQALETATTQHRVSETKAEAYRQALREYSGVPRTPVAGSDAGSTAPSASRDVQALTPQIDRTFIEGIVELSAINTEFRQEITRSVIDASLEAVGRAAIVEHYKGLLQSMRDRDGVSLPFDQVAKRLSNIIAEAKAATKLFNDIYDEFSAAAFRAATGLYRIEQPAQVTALRGFTLRSYVILVMGVALASPIVFSMICLALFHIRRYAKSAMTP